MSTKLKKYLVLIPTLFVMLFNCLCYGQVIAADEAIDYSVYHRSADDSPIKDYFDITDVDSVVDYVRNFSQNNSEYYFYSFYLHYNDDIKYSYGEKYSMSLDFSFISDYHGFTEDDNYYIVPTVNYSVRFLFTVDPSTSSFSSFIGNGNPFGDRLIYYKNTGSFDINTTLYYNNPYYNLGHYHYFQYTNIPDFPLYYDYDSSQSALNVDVVFNPDLSGEVDRSVTLDDGSTALRDSITMVVYNHSKFDIQYKMDIYRKEDLSEFATVAPGVYPVFTYYEKDWVYGNSLDNNADFWNKTEKQNKATSQHLIWSGRSDIVSFNFSQLPLSEGVNYTVVVRATRNDYKFPSEIVADYLEEPDPGRYQVSQSEVVFRSDFSMKQYSDVKYDHSDNSNGVLPFQGKDDKQQYENSYYAKEDDSGNVDYEGKDVYNDPDSWYNDKFNHDINHDKSYPGLVGDKESGGSSDGTFTSFASSFSNYFQFLAYIFNYFPVGIKNVFLIGFVGIMVVVLLKVVFKS